MKPKGDCYHTNGLWFLAHFKPRMRLCHGVVINAIDHQPMAHCWVERTQIMSLPNGIKFQMVTVIDKSNGLDVELPLELYYHIGQVSQVIRYTPAQVWKNLHRFGVWSDWGKLEVDR